MAVKSQVREGDIIRVPEKRGAWVVIEAKMAGGGHCGLGGGDDYPDGWRVTCSLLDESPAAYQYNPLAPTFRFYQTGSWSGVPTYKAVEAFDAYRGGYPWGTAPDIEPEIGDRGVTLETNFKRIADRLAELERRTDVHLAALNTLHEGKAGGSFGADMELARVRLRQKEEERLKELEKRLAKRLSSLEEQVAAIYLRLGAWPLPQKPWRRWLAGYSP